MTDERRTGLEPWVPTFFAILPLTIAVLINIVYLIRYAFRGPIWLRPFVQEPIDDEDIDDKSLGKLSHITICLWCLSVLGFVVQLCMALRLPWAIMPTIAWALAAFNLVAHRPRTAPVLLVVFFLSMFAAQLVILAAIRDGNIRSPINIMGTISAITAILAAMLGVNIPLRDPSVPSKDISKPYTAPTSVLRSPEDNMTLWQWMSVSWMSPMISLGAQRQLDDADVWFLGYDFQTQHLHDGFRELRGSIVGRLIRANGIDLGILGFLAVVELIANFSQPLLLQQLLLALEITNSTVQPAVTFGVLTVVASLVATQSGIFILWFGRRAYERSRGMLIMMLYEKTMARKIVGGVGTEEREQDNVIEDITQNSTGGVEHVAADNEVDATEVTPLLNGNGKKPTEVKAASQKPMARVKSTLAKFFTKKKPVEDKKLPASMGKIINMFRNDAYEIAQRIWEADQLITKPMSLILALALSWRIIGWSISLGVGVVVVAQVLNVLLARVMISWEKTRRKVTDDRLQKTSQFIEAIRHLRWYGWQSTWLVGIMESRQRELKTRVITSLLKMGINITSIIASGMLPVATFYAYTELAGKQLRVDIAFPALALFDMLQRELRDLPQMVTAWLNAMVAVNRLEEFMAEPDRSGENDAFLSDGDNLELNNATFAWPGSTGNVLQNVNLRLEPGLNVVFGNVAAGKTALLQALLGELNLVSGELVKPDKAIGYCAQTPWLQSMSIRDNILFSAPYDQARYKETIEACALVQDFINLKDGDLSEIGENGIGLSGGQKARVALARAVYSRTEILLLDDPLSALDQQTAEWVAKRCLNGTLMTGRVVVLVTHRTDLCKGIAKQMIEISQMTAHISDEEFAVLAAVKSREAQQSVDVRQAEKEQESTAVPDKFLSEEHRATGGIRWTVYWQFIKAGGAWTWIALLVVDFIFHTLLFVRNWFLKEWGEAYKEPQELSLWLIPKMATMNLTAQAGSTPLSRYFEHLPDPAINPNPWLIGLVVIVLIQSAAWLGDQCVMVVLIYTTGRRMFQLIMDRVTNAIFHFYDITPVGRLMNRMTSDIGAIDGRISGTLSNVIFWGASWVITVFVIASTTPAFLVAAALLTIAFVLIFLRFLPTSQSLRRLETISLSPLMSNFGALVEGLTTVRAFCAQPRFRSGAIASVDKFQKMDHFYWSVQAWLQYRFDILSAMSTFAMTLLAIFTGVSPGLTAFVLRAAGRLVQNTHAMCKEYGQLQMDFVSVERVVELFHIEQEPKGTINPPAWWPSCSSDVVFENTVIRYGPHLEPALSGISFTLPGGSNTAITGRTGSGKSTLALALLGTILPESGRILIGGIDVAQVDKQALRSRISFLAQDPVLFPGSMRQNLDPTTQHSDAECEAVLQRVCGRFGWTLATEIDAGGKNLSQGQRQLIGLCRAILRRSALIIMDEATASIDTESAWEIQRVVREVLTESTVITIAHRSEAVRGADYCLNLGKGKIVSFGRVEALAVSEDGGVGSR